MLRIKVGTIYNFLTWTHDKDEDGSSDDGMKILMSK